MSRTSRIVVFALVVLLLPSAVPVSAGELTFAEIAKRTASDVGLSYQVGTAIDVEGDTMVVGAQGATGATPSAGAAYVFVRNQGGGDAWQEVAKLVASDGAANDLYGTAVAISGDLIIVGAKHSDQGFDRAGAAYVYARNAGGQDAWGEVAKLTASDAADMDLLGASVAVDGDTVVAGAPNVNISSNDNGALYVFERNAGGADNWGQAAKIDGPVSSYYYMGKSVAIGGDTIVSGAIGGRRAYIFRRNQGGADNWGLVTSVAGSSSSAHQFGTAISISGDTFAVSGRSPSQPGAAWIFDRNQGGADAWGEVQRITASDGTSGDTFGDTVSISGDRVLVGAPEQDPTGNYAGEAYVYERNAGGVDSWGETQQLFASDHGDYLRFGFSVALDGATAVIGAIGDGGLSQWHGAAYVFASCGTSAVDWTETAKTVASDGVADHQYAKDVAFNGDIAVVGAKYDADLGGSAGAAYILMQNLGGPDNWGELKKIYAADGYAGQFFGQRVAMSDDIVVVGTQDDDALGTNSGAVYVFSRNQGGADNWGQVAKLTASDGVANAWFGYSVAVDGDILVVGAVYDTGGIGTNAGAAYVFSRNQGGADTWGEVKKLTASDGYWQDMFGYSVAAGGDTIAVGAWRESTGSAIESGAVYIFSRNQGGADNWGEVAKLKASDAATNDYFGSAVDLSNDTVVVGTPSDDDAGFSSGSAYVFERNYGGSDAWGQVAKLTASDAAAYDLFASPDAVTIDGDVIVIGCYKHELNGIASGSIYVFERNQGGADAWGETVILVPSDQSYAQNFGNAVDLVGGTVMVGAVYDATMGSVYFFDVGCPEFDYGDAPDPDYPTLAAFNGARHKLGGGVYLGAAVDMDLDGQPTAAADGDDTDAEGDDEDGVFFTSLIVTGATADVDVVASNACLLNAWIDFNDDGDWDDTGEQIFTNEALAAGTNSLSFGVSLDTFPGEDVIARFRANTAGGLGYEGGATDGEVEDHEVHIEELDFGDAPDPTYPTLLASDGARHVIDGTTYLGAGVDGDIDGQPTASADGDDTDAQGDDEDGISYITWPVAGQTATVRVTASTAGFVNAWIDYNADGDWADAGEQVFTDVAVVAGQNNLDYTIPITATTGVDTYARFRFSTAGGLSYDGLAPDGEVEDYKMGIMALDYGDAPDPTYPTLDATDGARHIIGGGLYLGASVDFEADGQPTASADGDDLDGNDDEDGVVFTSGIGAGLTAFLDVTSSGVGKLNAWVDFNADGDWSDAGEQVFTDQTLVAGANFLSFAVPASATLGTSYARFRLDTNGGLAPNGYATDGEVEDYQVEIVEGPDLQIEMTASSDPAASGRPLTYTITVTNNGPLSATSVTVTDALPGELIFISSTPGSPDCTFAADTLTCDLGTMAPTDTAQITIETVLDHPVWGFFSNTSFVTATEIDPITANNTATIDTIIAIFVDGYESGDLSAWD